MLDRYFQGLTFNVHYNSNGYQGGDAGHGSTTILTLENTGGSININGEELESGEELKIVFRGDWELSDLIASLEITKRYLENMAGETAESILENNGFYDNKEDK